MNPHRRRRTRPEAVGGLVAGVLGDLGLDGPTAVFPIVQGWPELVGPEAAAHSVPRVVRGTTLEIDADSPVWVQTLRLRAPEILARLAAALGPEAPRELWIRVGTLRPD